MSVFESIFSKTDSGKTRSVSVDLFIISFIIVKFEDLFLPYFWDELGVYSQCSVYQVKHGISLMPGSLPDVLSRGHPLLFTVINACIMKVFGCSVFTGHAFQLLVSVCLLLAVYHYTSKYFDPLSGFISVVILAIQPIFMAQSVLVLPEIMLSLLAFLSLVNYYERKYFFFSLFACLAILTKESAVVLPCVAFAYSVLQFPFSRNTKNAFTPLNLFFTFLPFLVFGAFLLVQKQQNGWYFFPYHLESVTFNFDRTLTQFHDYLNFFFFEQGRQLWLVVIAVALIAAGFTNKINRTRLGNSVLPLLMIFVAVFLIFCSISFWGERYAMPALVLTAMVVGVSIATMFTNRFLAAAVTLLFTFLSFRHMETEHFNYDNDMSYRKSVIALQEAVDHSSEISHGKEIVYGNFPAYFAINFPEGGYRKEDKPLRPTTDLTDSVSYHIISNPGIETRADSNRFSDSVVAVFKKGYAEVKIYALKKK